MNLESALACIPKSPPNRETICVETRRPPYATFYYYSTEIEVSDLSEDQRHPLLHHLRSSCGKLLAGQELYDLVDHSVLMELNVLANDVSVLPTKIWLA